MALAFHRPNLKTVPTGNLRVDWNHPLAQGLIGCWVPGVTRANLVGNTDEMANQPKAGANPKWEVRPEGSALSSEVNAGKDGISCTTTAPFKSLTQMSLYWRGHRTSTATSASSFNYPIIVGYNDGGLIAPYFLFGFQADSNWTNLTANTNNGSGTTVTTSAYNASAIENLSLAATYKVSGNVLLYSAGVQVGSVAAPSATPTTTSGSKISINCWDQNVLARGLYGSCYVAYIYNRELTVAEIVQLDLDPYAFLISGDGEWPALYVASAGTTLTADAESYTLTGTAASIKAARIVVAVAGSYSLSGTATTIRKNKPLVAASGSYAISGTAATLRKGKVLAAASGSYAITGTSASIKFARKVVAGSGSYLLTGSDVALTKSGTNNKTISASAGSYNLTGTAATVRHAWKAAAGAGSYAITGTSATLKFARRVVAGAGSYSITGTAATISNGRRLSASSSSYVLTGQSASIIKGQRIIPALSGSYLITGSDASLTYFTPNGPRTGHTVRVESPPAISIGKRRNVA